MVSLLAAAVAMGNAVVMVPSPKYPLPALEFIQVSSVLPPDILIQLCTCVHTLACVCCCVCVHVFSPKHIYSLSL